MKKLTLKILETPIIGEILFYTFVFPVFIFVRLLAPLFFMQSGYKRMKYGVMTVWLPEAKKQAVHDGLEYLRNCDSEVYLNLTTRHRLLVFYSHNRKTTNWLGYVFGLHERYIQLGDQGIALFFVQSLFLSVACPGYYNQFKYDTAKRNVPRKVLEWMRIRAFDPRLISSYTNVVEKWEQDISPKLNT